MLHLASSCETQETVCEKLPHTDPGPQWFLLELGLLPNWPTGLALPNGSSLCTGHSGGDLGVVLSWYVSIRDSILNVDECDS